jgi:hypothetical protein
MRQTQVIYDTVPTIVPTATGPRVQLRVRDKWSPFGFLTFRRGGARTVTRVGLWDSNFLGRLYLVSGELNSNADIPFLAKSSADKVGNVVFAAIPRLAGSRFSPAVLWSREFFDFAAWRPDGSPGLVYDRARIAYRAGTRYDLTNDLTAALTATTYDDQFALNSLSREVGPVPAAGRTTALAAELQLGFVNEDLSRYQGWQINLVGEGSRQGWVGSDFTFLGGGGTLRSFWVPRPGHNLGVLLAGHATSGRTDSHLLRVGGLYEIRGFLDATFLGQRVARTNLEYRIEVLDARWPFHTITQLAAFADGGYVDRRADAVAGLAYQGTVAGAGAGLRVNIVPLVRAVGRVDFAFGLHPLRRFDLALGVQQFF